MADVAPDLDQEDVEDLARDLLRVVRSYYIGRAPSRKNVFEVSNAVAFAMAAVLHGAGDDQPQLRSWFDEALTCSIAQLRGTDVSDLSGVRQ